ncbi:MAG: FHA domain-containing protein [Crocinitomicaceae bacterium]|jgi:pSer/pThr/pTyr-binding forkhead associated (FHA) protein|nr:FHA domain-containing protein [Crocinitomicaceae bacterium]
MDKVRLIKVGSASDNDVVINHEAIAPHHLELFQDSLGKVFLSDMNSISGTFVNGNKVNVFRALNASDKVTIAGKFMFDWLKLTHFKDLSVLISENTQSWIASDNKTNAVLLPELTYEVEEGEEDYNIADDASVLEKWNYFYTHNASIVHIFALNIVLFILFYLAFLS